MSLINSLGQTILILILSLSFLTIVQPNPFINRGKADLQGSTGNSLENGWILRNPYMGMMLVAIENQKMWEIPEVSYGNVAYEYGMDSIDELSKILDSLYKEPNFFYTSTIYTAEVNGTGLNTQMAKLKTRIHQLRWHVSDPRSIREINMKVAEQTYGKIKHFIPQVNLEIPIFARSSSGAFLNTFFYRNSWKSEWFDKGEGNFTNDNGIVEKVHYMEMVGQFDFFEFADLTAFGVNIPLKGEKKFVRLTKYQNLKAQPVKLRPGMNFRVKVPHLKLNSYGYLNYQKFGVTFCNIGQGIASNNHNMHFMQPIVQEHKLVLSPNVFLFTSASGNQVTNAQKFTSELVDTGRFPAYFNESEEYEGNSAQISPSGEIIVQGVPLPPAQPLAETPKEIPKKPTSEEIPQVTESQHYTPEDEDDEAELRRSSGSSNKAGNSKTIKSKNVGTKQRLIMNRDHTIYMGGGQGILNNGALSRSQQLLEHETRIRSSNLKKRRKKDKTFDLVFDGPFTIALYDATHGEIAIGDVASINGFNFKPKSSTVSPNTDKTQDDELEMPANIFGHLSSSFSSNDEIHENTNLYEKYELWSCGT